MFFLAESTGFVFISIDSSNSQRDYFSLPGPSAQKFGASFVWSVHPREGENAMGELATAVRMRHDLHSRLINARARTDEVLLVVRGESIYDRPLPAGHCLILYAGAVQ